MKPRIEVKSVSSRHKYMGIEYSIAKEPIKKKKFQYASTALIQELFQENKTYKTLNGEEFMFLKENEKHEHLFKNKDNQECILSPIELYAMIIKHTCKTKKSAKEKCKREIRNYFKNKKI